MTNVIYSGYYGASNSGDDAFCEVAAWGAEKYWNATKHLFFSRSLPKIVTSASHYGPYASYGNFLLSIKDIFKSDIFVSAGGSTFHSSLNAVDLRSYAKIKKYISKKGKIGAIGISLGPYKNKKSEVSTISYLQKLDFLALRDRKSYEIALSYNLPINPVNAFDLAALLPEIYPIKINKNFNNNNGVKTIGVAVCNYESYINGDISKEIQRNNFILSVLMQLASSSNVHFRFFIFNGNAVLGDEILTLKLIDKISQVKTCTYELIPYLKNVKDTYNKINECDLILSSRLHASIFACYGNTPFFLLEYHRKCTDFLDDIGQNQCYRIKNGEASVSSTCDIILEILYNEVYQPPKYIKETKSRALLNFTGTY